MGATQTGRLRRGSPPKIPRHNSSLGTAIDMCVWVASARPLSACKHLTFSKTLAHARDNAVGACGEPLAVPGLVKRRDYTASGRPVTTIGFVLTRMRKGDSECHRWTTMKRSLHFGPLPEAVVLRARHYAPRGAYGFALVAGLSELPPTSDSATGATTRRLAHHMTGGTWPKQHPWQSGAGEENVPVSRACARSASIPEPATSAQRQSRRKRISTNEYRP